MPLIDYLGQIVSPAANPATGDVIARGVSGGWTTASATGAPINAVLTLDVTSGLAVWSGGVVGTPPGLPTASAQYRGRIMTVGALGVADNAYICLVSAGGTYSWKLLATG